MVSTHIALEGAVNFRDLGGIRVGDDTIRSGRVFRADGLHRLTAADAARLEELAIGRIFDLRSDIEVSKDGVGEFAAVPGRRRHVPLIAVSLNPFDPHIDWSAMDLRNRYFDMLREGAEVIRTVLTELAAANPRPTVYHCSGGKDRTGVLTAVLLRALGVADDDIIADYALSERYLRRMAEGYDELLAERGLDREMILYLTTSPPERMRTTLDRLDEAWGGTEGYLDSVGLGADVVARLRANLLV